jgi:hypothetical protein
MARRRRRNRKKKYSAGFMVPTPLVTILVMAAVFSLSYLCLRGRTDATGQHIKDLEQHLEELQRARLHREYQWRETISWPNIRRVLARHRLDMDWPDKTRVVHVPYSMCRLENNGDRGFNDGHMRVAMND